MAAKNYDFSGWATVNDLLCADGRTIRRNAFKDDDGKVVPLVWNHNHTSVDNVLGKALLHNEENGVKAYCSFNDTPAGRNAKLVVQHGDVAGLSIYANKLKQVGGDVMHGVIREVSLVLATANPGALIDPILVHGDESDDQAIIYTGEELELYHAEEPEKEENVKMADKQPSGSNDKTIKEVFDTLTEEQKTAVYAVIGMAVKDAKGGSDDDDEDDEEMEHSYYEGDEYMKHNVFDRETGAATEFLSHSDMQGILQDAKRCGSLKEAVENVIGDGTLIHGLPSPIPTTGMTGPSQTTAEQTYGFRDPDMLFPEYKALRTQPEWIKRNTDWVNVVLNGAHHTPFSRIKSMFANLTEDEARARGYMKGNLKKEQVFTLLKRTTDPQTIYKKQKLDRDDVTDITDFDVVAWIKGEMRGQLDEEIARAALIGDGRLGSSDDKISEDHIRPIATDVDLFTIKATVDAGKNDQEKAKNFITAELKARIQYKGSGNPILFTTEEMLTNMLLIEDGIGHFLYKSEAELATTLRVSRIVTVEVMEGYQINSKDVLGIVVNPADYTFGADKGGAVALFDDFDIDVNQMKYLIETRCSGALTKPFSAITLTVA